MAAYDLMFFYGRGRKSDKDNDMRRRVNNTRDIITILFISVVVLQPLSLPTNAKYIRMGNAIPSAIQQPDGQPQQEAGARKDDQRESRIALIIGNSKYATSPLMHPENDARDLGAKLTELGFEVVIHLNLTKNKMERVISDFGRRVSQGGVGLFYFAGHGIQNAGQNYLVPVDAILQNQADVSAECVEIEKVLLQMERNSKINIVILDAGRNSPFSERWREQSRGLASMKAPAGTLIAYAAVPGSVASDGAERNSLYTSELIKQLSVPGLRIEDIFIRVRSNTVDIFQTRNKAFSCNSDTISE